MSSGWGQHIRMTIFGQSHSAGIGVVLEGLPAGFLVDMDRLNAFMARRAPGGSPLSTARKEADAPEVLSGICQGRTCGAPLAIVVANTNARPSDYADIRDVPRPGHADYTARVKYGGWSDPTGGGHFSGRLTAPLVAAGGICMQVLESMGVYIGAHAASVGDVHDRAFDPVSVCREDFDTRTFDPLTVLDPEAGRRMAEVIAAAREDGDSVGGVIECAAIGLPAGIGDPMFDGLEGRIASIVFGIPAVKGVEFGAGFAVARMRGSENNDRFVVDGGTIRTATNNAGGILGGISTGMPLIFRAAMKPTPSISRPQRTLDLASMAETELCIHGRHDPCIVRRAVPCVEAAAAVALADVLLPGDYSPLKG